MELSNEVVEGLFNRLDTLTEATNRLSAMIDQLARVQDYNTRVSVDLQNELHNATRGIYCLAESLDNHR